jgi:hypothetical protein
LRSSNRKLKPLPPDPFRSPSLDVSFQSQFPISPFHRTANQRPRTGNDFVFRYVYVHECSGQQGVHSHVLTALPQPAVAAFTAWTLALLPRLTGGQAGNPRSVVFRVRFGSEQVLIDRCWHWFRYLAKQCDATQLRDNNNDLSKGKGYTVLLRDVLQLWSHQHLQPVHCRQLSNASHDINVGAQRRAGPFQGLLWRRLDRLYDGAEVEHWRQRQELKEAQRRQLQAERLFDVLNRVTPPPR